MKAQQPKAIGLVGGIASGKSQVADYFRELGIEIIDTDQIARELVQPGSALLAEIVRHFGRQMLLESGELDRARLRQRIFEDQEAKRWLEHLLHPAIREEAEKRVQQNQGPYCIVAIPLLAKRQDYPFLSRILWVDAPIELRLQRLQERDHIDAALAQKMLAQQPSANIYRSLADDLLVNDQDCTNLQRKVKILHAQYSKKA